MADVYRARDTKLQRLVALKLLRDDSGREARERLLYEARAAVTFEHPNSVTVFDVGEENGVAFIAMELVRGKTLRAFVGDRSISIARRVRWLISVARALEAGHRTGLIHRDVKPANVMIREDGEVKVLDFGIACLRRAGAEGVPNVPWSVDETLVGTAQYSAPEQLRCEAVDGRADQFSWGVMAYELLSGRRPWDGEHATSIAFEILLSPVPSLREAAPDLPEEIIQVVERTLAKEREHRFASFGEVADALDPFAQQWPTTPRPLSTPPGKLLSEDNGKAETSSSAHRADVAQPAGAPAGARPKHGRRGLLASSLALGALVLLGTALSWRSEIFSTRRAAPAPSAAPAPVVVEALGCAAATVEGQAADAEIARAIGIGACARLAVEVGVSWGSSTSAHQVGVNARLRPDGADVTLRVAGREVKAGGETPFAAVNAAVALLAPELQRVPTSAEKIRRWGASSAAGASRIERVWQRRRLGAEHNLASELRRLLETDGDSPFPHLIAVMSGLWGKEAIAAERQKVLERLDRLPPSRADMVRGLLLVFPDELDRKEAVRLMRQSYTQAEDDVDMVSLYTSYAIRLGLPESFAVLDRLHVQAPTYIFGALNNAISRAPYPDPERNKKYFGWLVETLPEARAWEVSIAHLIEVGELEQARTAIDLGQKLGLATAADPLFNGTARLRLELKELNPKAASDLASPLVANPSVYASHLGITAMAASYYMEGKNAAAEEVILQEIERARGHGNVANAASAAAALLQIRRLLGHPPLEASRLAWLQALVGKADVPPALQAQIVAELALAYRRGGAADRAEHTRALQRIDEMVQSVPGAERMFQDEILTKQVALVRAGRGARAAAASWRAADHAPFLARLSSVLDAALAMEAIGDYHGAEQAYLLMEGAIDMRTGDVNTMQRMLAKARLVQLYRKMGRLDEAAPREATLDRLWSHADLGLRDAIRRMK